jgi:hypothetical protein
MRATGDIPEKDEVEPVNLEGARSVDIIKEVVEGTDESGGSGEIHAYFPNLEIGEDIHIKERQSHIWPDVRGGKGLIYVLNGDVERWLFPEDVVFLEYHYDE